MKNFRHPNLIIGLISFLVLLVGIGLKANGYHSGYSVIIGGVALGAIHWIWSIIDVLKHNDINSRSGILWTIIVIIIPPIGGMLYYMAAKNLELRH